MTSSWEFARGLRARYIVNRALPRRTQPAVINRPEAKASGLSKRLQRVRALVLLKGGAGRSCVRPFLIGPVVWRGFVEL